MLSYTLNKIDKLHNSAIGFTGTLALYLKDLLQRLPIPATKELTITFRISSTFVFDGKR